MLRRVRSITGVIMALFVVTHLINHMAGLWSLDAMQAGLQAFRALWANPLGQILLYGSFILHFALALWTLYARRSLRMPPLEALQLLLGLSISPLIALHVAGSRGVTLAFDQPTGYDYMLAIFFKLAPSEGYKQSIILLIVWLHAVIGLYLWWRFKPWFVVWKSWLLSLAVLLPTVSLLGVWVGGLEMLRRFADEGWAERNAALVASINNREKLQFVGAAVENYHLVFWCLVGLALAARVARLLYMRRQGIVEVSYGSGRRVTIHNGDSLLDASKTNGIAHASLCGGRGRCSTCRVRISRGLEDLPEPTLAEAKVLARVSAPPNVRLACQTYPTSDVEITPLLPPTAGLDTTRSSSPHAQGSEREVVILFADMRGFTSLSEAKLPYDVVFILNRYFKAMGEAIEAAGGRVDKFIGDGVMALFAVETSVQQGSQQALKGARAMAQALDELNKTLAEDLQMPLRIGIGIHAGPVIVGEMGHGRAVSLTAIGDAVNTASRLEAMTKELGAQLVVSQKVLDLAGLEFEAGQQQEVLVRGRAEPLAVRVFESAKVLQL